MSALDLSQEGPAINRSVKSVTTSSIPSGKSATHSTWVLLYVQAALRNAFSQGPPKPSVLKVQTTGEGELEDLLEEFNDGRVQFALAKVKDPNTQLGKNVFFAWCGEGVPEHVKGNYGSYQSAVAKLFEGYHVQVSARSSDTLQVDDIMRKVSVASGAAYSAGSASSGGASKPAAPPKPAWKPGQAYTPTRQYGTPAAPRGRPGPAPKAAVDADGWGTDAPQVSRTKLEKVESAYTPTKVNMKELMAQPSSTTSGFEKPDVVRGAYQPVGKVDIAAIRAQGDKRFDSRPDVVKGAYTPVGKVDIAAIRAAATPPKAFGTPAAFGTKPNLPSEYGAGPAGIPSTAPVGAANKDFASQGGKTPAQIWQEKKNRERGLSAPAPAPATTSGITLTGRRATILYDYEKSEDNEIDLVEGQIVGMIELVDDDWWQGTNEAGETGLFPSNYVEPIDDEEEEEEEAPAARLPPAPPAREPEPELEPEPYHEAAATGQTAVAVYDYEASEENELSFPEGATITGIEFPDQDWWFGSYQGAQGLFPANYVELSQ
ncbi:hypothetical protein DRE_00974 [Drechslerella stenobrocha 248]|uniref:Drebrin-like protein n=1 Tax=Drechslerella stenobrocha 248 TaxID=1043628 RepID=W7I7G7_9PEZI|nr:hypothetical protein DRE_00974 [Drechslerella stenobrocha 248]